ncbi:ras-related protein Rab-40B isoform X2 [Myotis lucifugus]|uniref:ras-related protein Rab-40B isoform X2 n=1 Tax=Myotis lucifugus TaxID=59463 RepID=UPI000CCC2478|nr:ras-related protein Rab-40B isoform X2 [Myotis lucifugus]
MGAGAGTMSVLGSPVRAYDFLLKFLLVGDSDVGKGEILASLQDGAAESPYGHPAGIDYKTTTILLDGRRVKLQLCLTCRMTTRKEHKPRTSRNPGPSRGRGDRSLGSRTFSGTATG